MGMSERDDIIAEMREYFEQRADAEYFTDSAGPVPNEERRMLARLDELQSGQSDCALGEALKGNTIPLPATANQAKGMLLVGQSWLEVNAPSELQASRQSEGGEAMVMELEVTEDRCFSPNLLDATLALPAGVYQLYTHPPQSQGVPEGWRSVVQDTIDELGVIDETEGVAGWHLNGAIASWDEVGLTGIREALSELLSTPAAPQADEWVKCADRLPTEADDDYQGCVWVHFEDGEVELMEAEEVEQTWDDDISITHWKPTGLTRPQPPEQGDGV